MRAERGVMPQREERFVPEKPNRAATGASARKDKPFITDEEFEAERPRQRRSFASEIPSFLRRREDK